MEVVLLLEVIVTMFVIMDPIGNVPIFLSVTRGLDQRARNHAAAIAVLAAALIIVLFAAIGQQLLAYLNVSVPALQGAGGLLLLMVALELLTGRDSEDRRQPAPGDHIAVAMVPLGTPLLAGPGAIVATIVFVSRAEGRGDYGIIAGGILVILLAIYLALRFSGLIIRVLRRSGILLLSRIAGLLLAAIAVQMLADAAIAFARMV